MNNLITRQLIPTCAVVILSAIPAHSETIYGLWQTYDVESGEPAEQVKISPYNDDQIGGWIAAVRSNPETLCDGKPETMRIQIRENARVFFDIQQDAENLWSGDSMLDFCSGELRHFTLTLSEDANTVTLTTKGLVSLFDQSQDWDRIASPQ